MFGLSKRHKKRIVAVADIGSATAGVAIVALEPGMPAVILASHRAVPPIAEHATGPNPTSIAQQLTEAAQIALSAHATADTAVAPITGIYAVVHAPWTRSTILHARKDFDTEMRITDDMIAALAKESVKSADGTRGQGFFEASVVRVELNGYPTAVPVNKHAHQAEVTTLTSSCEPDLFNVADDALARIFPAAARTWRSSARAVVAVTNALEQRASDEVIIEIGTEASDVIVVRSGIMTNQVLLPEGVHSILRRLSKAPPEETLTLLRMMGKEQCAAEACEAMNVAIARTEPDLVRIFGDALGQLVGQQRLPNRITLVTHPDLLQWLSHFFTRIDFTQFSVTAQPFTIVTLQAPALAHFAVSEGKMETDAGLLVAVASVHIENR